MDQHEIDQAAHETLAILRESGAIVENVHVVHISGLHFPMTINKDAIFPHLERVERLTRLLAKRLTDKSIEIVCGPAMGGLVVGEWLAHELGVMCAFAEHDPDPQPGEIRGRFVLRRGYDQLVAGRQVLVVDDIVNTGHSIRQTIDAVRAAGGNVVAAVSLVFVGKFDAHALGVDDYLYLLHYDVPSGWPPEECPLCRDGVPVNTRYGHGKEFLAAQGKG
ncbi:phosphoribosyltransferase family protein [Aeoliella sp.]|uniref:phosphoribosyltransferase family protein n=1 Tax=Aeoliella sp. TaxID=2795800 RepID=UPI003CCB77C1